MCYCSRRCGHREAPPTTRCSCRRSSCNSFSSSSRWRRHHRSSRSSCSRSSNRRRQLVRSSFKSRSSCAHLLRSVNSRSDAVLRRSFASCAYQAVATLWALAACLAAKRGHRRRCASKRRRLALRTSPSMYPCGQEVQCWWQRSPTMAFTLHWAPSPLAQTQALQRGASATSAAISR